MKVSFITLLCTALLVVGCVGFIPSDASYASSLDVGRRFDAYDVLPFKDEKLRLFNYSAMLKAEPKAIGVIYIYLGNKVSLSRAQMMARRKLDYLVNKLGGNPERIAVIIVNDRERDEFGVELWALPDSPIDQLPKYTYAFVGMIKGVEIKRRIR